MLRAAALVCALLGLVPLTAACGGEEAPEVRVSDVIPAKDDDQFEKARAAVLLLPTGKLKVWSGEPVDAVDRADTRQLEDLAAPAGAVLVPLTWRLEQDFSDARGFLGKTPAPSVDLLTEGESYRLPSPDADAEDGESFYVVVDGDGEDLHLEVEFDGVKQALDLGTRERRTGRARALYDLDRDRRKPKDCGTDDWVDDDRVAVTYGCELTGPLLLPYANGEWAEPGHRWLAVRLRTTLRQWSVADGKGGGAFYMGTRSRLGAELDGAKPAATYESAATECPVVASTVCIVEQLVVFDVTDAKLPDELTVKQRFQLTLLNKWGGFRSKERMPGEVRGTVALDLPRS